jgi:hypothetical protein
MTDHVRNVEETIKTTQDLRMDVNATEQWCQQLQAFIENNQFEYAVEVSRTREYADESKVDGYNSEP